MLSIFSCACWPSVCLLWRNILLGLLHFLIGFLFFLILIYLYILEINPLWVPLFAALFSQSIGYLLVYDFLCCAKACKFD